MCSAGCLCKLAFNGRGILDLGELDADRIAGVTDHLSSSESEQDKLPDIRDGLDDDGSTSERDIDDCTIENSSVLQCQFCL